jgi:hypothetical protein
MKQAQLLCVGMLAFAIAVMAGVTARADVITLQVLGFLSPAPGFSGSCASTGCTIVGDIKINNVTGAVLSADVTAAGFSPGVGPFTAPSAPHPISGGPSLTVLEIGTASSTSEVALIFPTQTGGSLVGYTGSLLSTLTDVETQSGFSRWDLIVGNLTEARAAPVPEPSTWAMMLLGFAGLGFAGYRQTRRGRAAIG